MRRLATQVVRWRRGYITWPAGTTSKSDEQTLCDPSACVCRPPARDSKRTCGVRVEGLGAEGREAARHPLCVRLVTRDVRSLNGDGEEAEE
jgi:hypothetical protein